MIESVAQLIDTFGVLVGLGALTLSVYVIGFYREKYDTPYVAALYIVGTILVFLSFEVPVQRNIGPMFGRSVIFLSVLYWEYVILAEVGGDGFKWI